MKIGAVVLVALLCGLAEAQELSQAGRKVAQIAENRELWDFGQNACYVPEIRVRGPRGAGVRVFFAEKSNRAGIDLMGAGGETGSYVRGTSIGYILRGMIQYASFLKKEMQT